MDLGPDELDIENQMSKLLDGSDRAARLRDLIGAPANFDRDLWSELTELGWLAVSLPEARGGMELGFKARCVIARELGRKLAAVPFTATTCVINIIGTYGSADAAASLSSWARGGAIATLACFEASHADIPSKPRTVWKDGRLYGRKIAVPAGMFADSALVHALDTEGNVTLVLLELGKEVVRHGANTLDNSRGYATLDFHGAPASRLGGADVFDALLDQIALTTAFEQAGGAHTCLEMACGHALGRWAFGRPIGANQSVKHALADMYVQLALATGVADGALRVCETAPFPQEAAGARLAASQAYDLCAQEAIQLHGAMGVTWESSLHLHYRRARCLAIEWGAASMWRQRLLQSRMKETTE